MAHVYAVWRYPNLQLAVYSTPEGARRRVREYEASDSHSYSVVELEVRDDRRPVTPDVAGTKETS